MVFVEARSVLELLFVDIQHEMPVRAAATFDVFKRTPRHGEQFVAYAQKPAEVASAAYWTFPLLKSMTRSLILPMSSPAAFRTFMLSIETLRLTLSVAETSLHDTALADISHAMRLQSIQARIARYWRSPSSLGAVRCVACPHDGPVRPFLWHRAVLTFGGSKKSHPRRTEGATRGSR